MRVFLILSHLLIGLICWMSLGPSHVSYSIRVLELAEKIQAFVQKRELFVLRRAGLVIPNL